ncbi:MAG: class I SAM-dependent methyltransferase [Saprospiraceae bacterium]
MSLRKIYYSLSPNLRFLARKVYYFPNDLLNSLLGKRHKYEPKQGDIYIGSGDFIKQGQEQINMLIQHVDLQAIDRVLDIGSGIGRTALPLTEYLNEQGSYAGFDVVQKGVDWCNQGIGKDFSNFKFTYVPLNNDLYNNAAATAERFKFPYADNDFTKAFLFSVFTHMAVTEIENYLKEIGRVMQPEGKCLATFFLFNAENADYIATENPFKFPVDKGHYKLMDEQVTAANIAVREDKLNKMVAQTTLRIDKIVYGYWRDGVEKSEENIFQDMVVLVKK